MSTVVIDTSAVVAILDDEPGAPMVRSALDRLPERVMAAPTLAETLLVGRRLWRQHASSHVNAFLRLLDVKIAPCDEQLARTAAHAMQRYGKGNHPAGLNYGDSFSYALAKTLDAPLLFVGSDFSRTDIAAAVSA